MFKLNNKKKGQSTIEYIIGAAVVVGIAVTLTVPEDAPFRTQLTDTVNSSISEMGTMKDRLHSQYEDKSR